MNRKKILFYSHDTFGLGHINRILAIGNYLSRHREGVSVLLVSGSGIIHGIRIPRGIDYIKLPSVTKTGDESYRSKYLSLSLKETLKLRETILLDTAVSFKPDIFVVDNVPLGLKKEAQPTLEALRKSRPACRIVLSMRDILDDPAKIRRNWNENGIYGVLNSYFDAVLVFGLRDLYDVTKEYDVPEPASSKFLFCGYIKKSRTFDPPEKIRDRLDINGHRFILITAGGGGDGEKLIETSLEAMERYKEGLFKSLVVLGPDFPEKKEKKIRARYWANRKFIITNFVDHLPDFINASDLVISMGGYNTICEILSLRKRAIVVPRVRPRVEQLIRAKRMSERGLLEYIHPERLHPESLKKKIKDHLLKREPFEPRLDLGGLRRASEVVGRLLSS